MDILRMDYINSLPQPFMVRLVGEKDYCWPVHDIAVDAACFRVDVCGKLQAFQFAEAASFMDAYGVEHDPETFYSDYEEH